MLSTDETTILKNLLEEITVAKSSINSLIKEMIEYQNQLNTFTSLEEKEKKEHFNSIYQKHLNYVHVQALSNSIEESTKLLSSLLKKLDSNEMKKVLKNDTTQNKLSVVHHKLLIQIINDNSIFKKELSEFKKYFHTILSHASLDTQEKILVDFKVLLGDNSLNLSENVQKKIKASKENYFSSSLSQFKHVVFKTILKGTVMSDSLNKKVKEGIETSKEVVKNYAPKVKDELVKTFEPTIQKTAQGAKEYLAYTVDKIVDELLNKPKAEDTLSKEYQTYHDYCVSQNKPAVDRERFEELYRSQQGKADTKKVTVDGTINTIKDELKNISAEQVVKQIVKNVVLAKKGPWGIALSIAFDAVMEAQKESRNKKQAQDIAKRVDDAVKQESAEIKVEKTQTPTETVAQVEVKENVKASTQKEEVATLNVSEDTTAKASKDLSIKTKQDLFELWLSFISLVKTTSKKERVSSRGLYENYVEFCKAQELDGLTYNQSSFTRQFKQKMNIKNEEVTVVDGQETRVFNFKMKK